MEDTYFEDLTPELKLSYLKQRQALPLSIKQKLTERRIIEFYEHFEGEVYVAFSGGIDSTVLLHQVRSIYPDVPAVFVDTGLEFPEIREFVKQFDNVAMVKPKKTFKQVIEQYGFPVVSKQVAMAISRYQNTKSEVQKNLRLWGGLNPNTKRFQSTGVIPQKYHYLTDAPFKISEQCCTYLKKNPLKEYEKETGRKPFIATMAVDSRDRRQSFVKGGCNAFNLKTPQSRPMMFWLKYDVWNYIHIEGLEICDVYTKGEERTGCIFCMFGCQHEVTPNRFQRLKKLHPDLHDYCINKLGLGEVLTYMNIPYE